MRTSALVLAAVCFGGCATTASGPSWRGSEHVARPSEKGDLDAPPSVTVVACDTAPVREATAPPAAAADEEAPPPADPAPRRHVAARRSAHHRRR
jgi:hypothetical protein